MKYSLRNISHLFCFGLFLFGMNSQLIAQNNNVGIGTSTPDESAILDISSTEKGLLIPRLTTTQQGLVSNPAEGLMIYNSAEDKLKYYDSGWKGVSPWERYGNKIYAPSGSSVGIGGESDGFALLHLKFGSTNFGEGIRMEGANGENWYTTINANQDYAIYDGGTTPSFSIKNNGVVSFFFADITGSAKIVGQLGIGGAQATYATLHMKMYGTDHWRGLTMTASNNVDRWYTNIDADGSYGIYDKSISNTIPALSIQKDTRNVGIRANALDDYALSVNGDGLGGIYIEGNTSVGAPAALVIGSGFAYKPGGGAFAATSDKRLKKDIINFTDGLSSIREINTIFYHYNGENGGPTEPQFVGVIAQELQEIAPYMVSELTGQIDTTKNYLTVDPSAFTYMLINSVQELDETVQKQQEIIETQQAELNAIKKALAKAGIELD
jgi:hypothetical protein